MGYFRTGELHRETSITIYARKVGDEKVTVRALFLLTQKASPQDKTCFA